MSVPSRRWITALTAVSAACGPADARVSVDPATRLQTMTGWEATAMAGQEDSVFPRIADRVLALAVDSLGINRLRVPVRAGAEYDRSNWAEWRAGRLSYREWRCLRYRTINDNDDPRRLDPRGFHWDELDSTIEQVVLPVQRRLAARGERLYVNINYTAFNQCRVPTGTLHHADPEEYAEFALATMLHLRDRYGIVPDGWEIILEPDHNRIFSGRQIGRLLVATAARLAEAGFHPAFIAPSNTNTGSALEYFDSLATVPGAARLVRELGYHRYVADTHDTLLAIGSLVRRYGISSAMLELVGADIDNLFQDVDLAGASAWQQYIITYPGDSSDATAAGHYVMVRGRPDGTIDVRLAPRARLLRQVFLYVREGAWRIGATSSRPRRVKALAFADSCGGSVLVARAKGAAVVTVEGLGPGPYAATWTTDSTEGRVDDVPLVAGRARVEIPAAGAITLFRREPDSAAPARCRPAASGR